MIRRSANSPLIDISPLQKGRRWKPKWLDFRELNSGPEYLLIFITPRCQLCKRWEPDILNLMDQENRPLPILIFPEPVARKRSSGAFPLLKGAVGDKGAKFWDEKIPGIIIKPGLFRYLVYQTPTAVLVRNNEIENKWVAHFPEEYI